MPKLGKQKLLKHYTKTRSRYAQILTSDDTSESVVRSSLYANNKSILAKA